MILPTIIRHLILSVESYHGTSNDIKNQQGQFTFSRDLAKTTPNLGSHILLVDDLADSGKTLIKIIKWLGRDDAPLKFRLKGDPKLLFWFYECALLSNLGFKPNLEDNNLPGLILPNLNEGINSSSTEWIADNQQWMDRKGLPQKWMLYIFINNASDRMIALQPQEAWDLGKHAGEF